MAVVLYRPKCTCGYVSSLGTPDNGRAWFLANRHYTEEHVLKETLMDEYTAIPYIIDVEPYLHD
jgi:hypothetical protein